MLRRLGNEVEDEHLCTYLHHQLCKLLIVLATVLHGFNAGVQGGGKIGHQDTVPLDQDLRTQAVVESCSCQGLA